MFRLSLGKLRDVLYDAKDVLDKFRCEALQKELINRGSTTTKLVQFPALSIPFAFPLRISHKIKRITEKLDTIASDFKKFNLGLEEKVQNRHISLRDAHSFVIPSNVIGRNQAKENIIDVLVKPTIFEKIPVIPIVGIGGLRKTTLAQLVYNDERITKVFPLKIWAYVSDEFDLARLLCDIICSITEERCYGLPVNALQTHLRMLLNGKTFLLVLDDVWNEDHVKWMELRDLLITMGNFQQSKILVTTRSSKVASIVGTIVPYNLKGLSHKDCLFLFVKWAFREGDEKVYPNLLRIGDEIVKKCKGVPLAVRTLGSLLYMKTELHEWEFIKDNDIWKLDQNENDILPMLKLSYNHLPSHLQRCLTYLSLVPKDTIYDTEYIVQFWMAIGLIESPKQNEEWEDVGLRYFKELWSRGFVEDVEAEPTFYRFKIHDLIHDLLLNVSQDDCLTIYSHTINAAENIRHLSFSDDNPLRAPQSFLKNLKGVRTLLILASSGANRIIEERFVNASFLNFKFLRLLDLSYSFLEVLPKSVGTLKHLRYLDLSGCQRMRKLPTSICKLQSLLTLRLLCVPLIEVPECLQRLISLRFLEITTDSLLLRDIHPGCWSSLQFLHLIHCDMIESIFEGMQHLTSLRTLVIKFCSSLISLPRSLKFLTKLEEIEIVGCKSINLWMEQEGQEDQDLHLRLKTLTICGSEALEDLPRLLLQGSATTFKSMLIERCPNFKVLPEWMQNLTSLERLELAECPALSSLPDGLNRLTALRQVKIQKCPELS
ncbi:putative disease resistance protein RGA4 [Durio zibethinus]|uniref:Disease resistance protein RGA4 n=1 Tax=Durio zibethinus TaxID=66656 RepID=A0A6P5WV24_DURZI|nr:putative disease resistance protein RGA4 [Durio zibethinus]